MDHHPQSLMKGNFTWADYPLTTTPIAKRELPAWRKQSSTQICCSCWLSGGKPTFVMQSDDTQH
eukprot:3060456-Amphidinium_carterae.1